MTEHQRPHWARFLMFLAILFCVFQLINFIPKQERADRSQHWRYFYKDLPKNSVDIVFMGNSHAQCTFIPEVIDAILGTKSIDLATPSGSIYQTNFEYKETLRYQNPKAVVIETSAIYWGRARPEKYPELFSFFDSMPLSLRKISYLQELFSIKELFKYYFPIYANHTDWKTPALTINKAVKLFAKINSPILLENQGYHQLSPILNPVEDQVNNFKEPDICLASNFADRLSATEETLRIDESDPSTLLFIESPTYLNEYKGCKSQIYNLLDSFAISHHKLFDNMDLSYLWFYDPNHLSQFGAVIASIETAQLLSENLGIPMNLDALEYFKSYQFKEYQFKKDDKSIYINLIPFDEESSKNLNYQWEVLQDGKIIHMEEIQGGNKFNFILPDLIENYSIMVKINNPGGDYELVGMFPITIDKPVEAIDE